MSLVKYCCLLFVPLFFVACATKQSTESTPISSQVEVTGGIVEGVIQDDIASFKGIPFAAPPVGELRWKAPQPVVPWQDVKDASDFAPGPMQDTAFGASLGGPQEVSEDCLYLNVWTGAKNTGEKRPVMVWIYGGGFGIGMTSSPTYDGTNLAKKGVVLVSVAYRVGPMGFLAHPELSAESGSGSGAYGIQDQIAGLRWVQENITRFGGNPENVTIFGESAGGYSVSMLAASPSAGGLFHRAISESGGNMAPPRMTLKAAEEMGKAYLEQLGAKDIQAARALPAEVIQSATKGMGSFWPVPDNVTFPEKQYEAYEAGRFNDTPVLIGTNSDEGGLFVMQKTTPAGFADMVRKQYAAGADAILKAYPHSTEAEATRSAKDLFRESAFAWPTWAWAKLHSRNGKGKVFTYYFDHRTTASPDGANHAAELPFVFGNLGGAGGMGTSADDPKDKAMSELIMSYWVNFAGTGDPNGPGLPDWPAFTEADQKAMFFDNEPGARDYPNLDQLQAFDEYFSRLR
uniref:Carboxylic ester hydrolase n=1 Tax=uncultured bacterium contig00009 TaxID=1181501 RepID=A0A806KDY1_9BACT|nr:carboxylesterase, type B [uncultured bacterium contig00009]